MKTFKLTSLLAIPLILCGCTSKGNSSSAEVPPKDTVTVNMMAYLNTNKTEGYDLEFKFNDNYFQRDTSLFDGDLMRLSFASSLAATSVDTATDFFTEMGYDNLVASPDYGHESATTVQYFFAHKTIGDFELIAVANRGFEYGVEWSNNLDLGSEGDHKGFTESANKVYTALKSYIQTSYADKNIKLWMTGYSRAGAIANVLSYKLMSSEELNITDENLFTYTFEAPRGLSEEHAIEYSNVHNLINSADLVTYVAPEAYGLYRCGTDIDIYKSNYAALMYDFDDKINLSAFTADGQEEPRFTTLPEFASWLMGYLTSDDDEDKEGYSLATREDYNNNLKAKLQYFVPILMSMTDAELSGMIDYFKNLSVWDLLPILDPENGATVLDEYVETYLTQIEKEFDHDQLLNALTGIHGLVLIAYPDLIVQYGNLGAAIQMHMPEMEYVLINDLMLY